MKLPARIGCLGVVLLLALVSEAAGPVSTAIAASSNRVRLLIRQHRPGRHRWVKASRSQNRGASLLRARPPPVELLKHNLPWLTAATWRRVAPSSSQPFR